VLDDADRMGVVARGISDPSDEVRVDLEDRELGADPRARERDAREVVVAEEREASSTRDRTEASVA
jgi:hypothetical protein